MASLSIPCIDRSLHEKRRNAADRRVGSIAEITVTLTFGVLLWTPKPCTLKRFLSIILLTLVAGDFNSLHAQYKKESDASIPLEYFYIERQNSGLRTMLSRLHFSISTGYGNTPFRHSLDGFGIVQQPDSLPLIFSNGNVGVRYSEWTREVTPSSDTLRPGSFMVNSDTARLGFGAKMFSIPLKASVHVEFDRYRLGGGLSFDYTRLGPFQPTRYEDDISGYSLDRRSMFVKHYFAMLGATVYEYYDYALVVDANIGGYSLGSEFAGSPMSKSVYINLGVRGERHLSEYFRLFIRPSYEVKSYRLDIPETTHNVQHRLDGFFLNFGFTYRIPELPRCFLKKCHAQINHAHGNREYRSRRHPFYKKQNPHYGENYPELIKYKGRNKRKLNPY